MKRTLFISLLSLSFMLGGVSLAFAKYDGPSYKLKFALSQTNTSAPYMGAMKMAEIVKEKTDGKVVINVYPNEVLSSGNQQKGMELLIQGITDFSSHSQILWSVFDERFAVVNLPFLFKSEEEAIDKIDNGPGGEALKKLAADRGLINLAFGHTGFRQLTTNSEVKTVADLKNLKIRVPGIKMYSQVFTELGAMPLTMNFAELFTSLQQGTVDGQENPIDSIAAGKIEEVQKYICMWNYSYEVLLVNVNAKKFNSFPPELQQIIREAAKEGFEYQRQLTVERNETLLKEFQQKGMTVVYPTDEALAEFKERVQPVYQTYEPIIGKDLIDAFK